MLCYFKALKLLSFIPLKFDFFFFFNFFYIRALLAIENEIESHSVMSNSVTPGTVACQAPLYMEFSRPEYWSG